MPRKHLGALIEAAHASPGERVIEHHDCVVVTTPYSLGAKVITASAGFERLTGYAISEVLGKNLRCLQGPRTSAAVIGRLRVALASGSSFEGQTWNYRKDGTPFIMQWTIDSVAFEGESYLFSVQRDATQQTLRAQHNLQLRNALDDTSIPHLTVAIDGSIVATSARLDEVMGESTVGRVLAEVPALSALSLDLTSGTLRELELGGELFDATALPVDVEGEVLGHVVTFTARFDMEKLERLASSLTVNQSVGSVFAGIRHELGNPVNSMKSALTVLSRQHRAMSSDRVTEYLEGLLDQCSRLEFLLRALRGLTSGEDLDVVEANPSVVLDNLCRIARTQAAIQGYSFEYRPAHESRAFTLDERVLFQALMNLLSNAFDAVAMSPSQSVTLSTRQDGVHFEIRLVDSGPGLSFAQQKRLFSPFFTTKPKGTGLGLVISRKLLHRLGGTLELNNREDGQPGVCALVRLPLSTPGGSVPPRRRGSGLFEASRG